MNIISYSELTHKEDGKHVSKGINYAIQNNYSIVLMSTLDNAPYNDRIFDSGIIEYEGHNVPSNESPNPEMVDQSLLRPSGNPTENGCVDVNGNPTRETEIKNALKKISPEEIEEIHEAVMNLPSNIEEK